MVQFKWHTAGSDTCFKCARWEARIFKNLGEVPELPVHPNCQCFIEALTEDDLKKLAEVGRQLEAGSAEVEEGIAQFSLYSGLSYLLERLVSAAKELLGELLQISQTFEIFRQNYDAMKKANTIGADKYFHSKANAEAAQLGVIGEATAKFISDFREFYEYYTNVHLKGMSLKATIEDMNADQRANYRGRVRGRQFPDRDAGELVKDQRPNGLGEKY
ncbi:MAG: hypothetical protein GC129_00095 [Proteobacteria bacterium]|nr:hypothetical protein [Pseudomonadota bacterium]